MSFSVDPNPSPSGNTSSTPPSSSALTPMGEVEKLEKDYKVQGNRNGTVNITKIISLKVGDNPPTRFELKIYNISSDPKVISKFLGEQENKLLSLGLTQLTRKSGSVKFDSESGLYSTKFKTPFLMFFSHTMLEKNFLVNRASREKFFTPELDKLKGKLALYQKIRDLGPQLTNNNPVDLNQEELELLDVMKEGLNGTGSHGQINRIPKYKDFFDKSFYFNKDTLKGIEQKIEELEKRVELCTTAARVYLNLSMPKPKPAATTPTPETPPVPPPILSSSSTLPAPPRIPPATPPPPV